MQSTQKFQRMQNLPSLLTASHLPQETFDNLMPHIIIPKRDTNTIQQR